jgi:hypothetical protein
MLQQRGGKIVRGVRRGIGHRPLDGELLGRVAGPVVPSRWPQKLPGKKIALHAARFDRLVSCGGIERLAQLWGARLQLHQAAHYSLAVSTRIFPQVAEDVLAFTPCP